MPANGTAPPRYEFDETDRKILDLLKANGRATNQKIARILKISAAHGQRAHPPDGGRKGDESGRGPPISQRSAIIF